MLRKIKVSGFKSLDKFELEFQPGLNVIIGPNGSGKTNIINFIEFVSYLARNSLLDGVGKSGGAGSIFRRNSEGGLVKQITFTISGDGEYEDYWENTKKSVAYEFSAEISLSEKNSISYTYQRLKLALGSHKEKNLNEIEWGFDLEVNIDPIENISAKLIKADDRYFESSFFARIMQSKNIKEKKNELKNLVNSFLSRENSVVNLLDRYISGVQLIKYDLLGAKSFNITPSVVRQPEDIASEPGIAPDGKGLAPTLYTLKNEEKKLETKGVDYYFHEPVFHKGALQKIIEYSRLVNNDIKDIIVEPDPIENKLRIFLIVNYETQSLKLPFSLVSDGTAKWFTLVTAIITNPSLFSIEEPENYIHPLMQQEIINIVRNRFAVGEAEGFALLTTHSETILNCVDPSEIILVHMDRGRTHAARPSNVDDIRGEIKSTGFGAGYYYLAGAIE